MTRHHAFRPDCQALLLAFFAVLSNGSWLAAQTAWLPVPPEDLALKDNPALPGSSAMILYKEDTLDHQKDVREVYYRIKIFKEEGRKHADIEIPYLRGSQQVKDLAVRTIQPDGSITEFRGPFYDKTLLRARRLNYQAKTFALPDVQPGAIIEYRYRLEGGGWERIWSVQEPLFIRNARMTLKPSGFFPPMIRPSPPSLGSFFRADDFSLWTTLSNLLPFERESFMSPEEGESRYHVSYPRLRFPGLSDSAQSITPNVFWKELGEALAKFSGDFLGKPNDFRGIVQPLITSQDPAQEKLRKLYAVVQAKVRNLSYEESYSKNELRKEQMKERKSARDVWNYGYGSAEEITLLFVALCRAAGLSCDPVYVSGRDTHFFDEQVMEFDQLNVQVAVVDLPDGPRYFDPGSRFEPFGLLSWEKQGVIGFRVRAKESDRINLPEARAEEHMRHRRITVELQPDGTARVQAEIRYAGEPAIDRRADLFELSERQREQALRGELEEEFPAANWKQVSWKGLEGESGEVAISYSFELRSYALSVGSRLLVKPALFPFRSPFPNWKRKYSVYFPYPYTRTDEVRIVPPPGFRLEQLPREEKFSTPQGQFEFQATGDGDAVTIQRKLTVQEILHTGTPAFRQLKSFFDAVQASDQKHLVFRQP